MKSPLLPVSFSSSSSSSSSTSPSIIVSSKLSSLLSYLRHHHINFTKMFTRRNCLLRCSILINVAVILYICSHVMIGGGGNFATGPAFIIQDEGNSNNNNNNNINNNNNKKILSSFIENINNNIKRDGGGGGSSGGPSEAAETKTKEQENINKDSDNNLDDKLPQNSKLVSLAGQSSLDSDNSVIMNLLGNDDTAAAAAAVVPIQQSAQVPSQQQQQQQSPAEQQQQQSSLSVQQQQQHNPNDIEQQSQKEINNNNNNNNNINGDTINDVPTDPNEIAAQEKSQNEIAGQPDTIGYVNNSNTDGYIASGDEKDFDDRLRLILKCHDRDYQPETLQRGDFWVLKNYIRAGHGELKCHETITYTTHADYTFLDNLIPLLERWNSPVSIALHAPGNDFQPTINSIAYLRDCLPESTLVRQFVTFHIYFSTKHIPKNVPKFDQLQEFNCATPPPFANITSGHLYKTQKKLLYPVNVGRNIARDAAQTHFMLASDIELYPNPGLVKKFLEMIARNDAFLQRKYPRVFPLSIFEVESSVPVPKDKTELQDLLRIKKAIPFHKRVCSSCHGVPKSKEWMAANETEDLGVFHIGKRVGYFVHWEPIYIGTHSDPHYDERLSWEGKSDKMPQGYALCVLNYEFHILDNAFLVHKPGIKVLKKDPRRAMLAAKTNQLIRKIIYPELKIMYGTRKGCAV